MNMLYKKKMIHDSNNKHSEINNIHWTQPPSTHMQFCCELFLLYFLQVLPGLICINLSILFSF